MAKGHRPQVKRGRNANKDTGPNATLSHTRMSIQKACFVLDAIRGKDLQTALDIVTHNPRYASSLVKKLLELAAANAENNSGMDPAGLYAEECYVNQGPTMRRVRPRTQGRAHEIEKRMGHITVVLNERQKANIGQKVNPYGLRVSVIKDWGSEWYAEAGFADYLVEDYNTRRFLKKRLLSADIPKIEIEYASDRVKIIIHTTKSGMMVGRGGPKIEELKKEVQKLIDRKLLIDIEEIKCPDRGAQLAVESITGQLESHVSFRRAMKSTTGRTVKAGVEGIETAAAGRLGGADMTRTESCSEGIIPLQTLRADVDYGLTEVDITCSKIGVKIWIYKGKVLPTKGNKEGSDK